MAKPRKVIRTKTLYKKRRLPVVKKVLLVLVILLLIPTGYIIMREWNARFGKDAQRNKVVSSEISSTTSSSEIQSSQPQTKEPEEKQTSDVSKTANISAQTLLQSGGDLSQKLSTLKSDGYTSVILELKSENGMLSYKSNNEMALKYGAISENAVDLSEVFKAVTDAELNPIARISTLKDSKAPHVSNENSYAYSTSLQTNWLDNSVANGGKPWLNPYMDNTKQYIGDITKEISDVGFKTIILENVMFPDKNTGKMNTIKTTPDRSAILNQFVAQVQEAAPDSNVIRSLDVVFEAKKDVGFEFAVSKIVSKDIALDINLSQIEANKQQICEKSAIVDQNGYDKNITAVEVCGELLDMAKAKSDNEIIPIISLNDFNQLEQVFKDKDITNYIIL